MAFFTGPSCDVTPELCARDGRSVPASPPPGRRTRYQTTRIMRLIHLQRGKKMKQDPANKGQSILHGQRVFGLTKPERWMVLDYNLFLDVRT